MKFLCFEITYIGFRPKTLDQQIIELLEQGKYIPAVKLHWEATDKKSLLESKTHVVKLRNELTRRQDDKS